MNLIVYRLRLGASDFKKQETIGLTFLLTPTHKSSSKISEHLWL